MSDWRAQEARRKQESEARAAEEATRKAAALQAIKGGVLKKREENNPLAHLLDLLDHR